ncbi:MAG: NblA/ycf18 family protein [Waterburya sp.]
MSDSIKLSLEQKFNVRSFETEVKAMSHEQAQEFLVKLYEQMIIKDNMYQYFIRQQWEIDVPPRI